MLHERTIFLTFITRDIPYVNDAERVTVRTSTAVCISCKAAYGFNETPDVKAVLMEIGRTHDMTFELMDTSFFLARETVVPTQLPGMSVWRERVFAWMHQNAAKPTDFLAFRRIAWVGVGNEDRDLTDAGARS